MASLKGPVLVPMQMKIAWVTAYPDGTGHDLAIRQHARPVSAGIELVTLVQATRRRCRRRRGCAVADRGFQGRLFGPSTWCEKGSTPCAGEGEGPGAQDRNI